MHLAVDENSESQPDLLYDDQEQITDPYDDEERFEIETGESGAVAADTTESKKKKKYTLQEIESLFAARQDRTIHQKFDFLITQIVAMVKDESTLMLAPKYQRRFRWSRKKQSLFIESLLLNVPMPPVFLYETSYAKYEVMDGRQRLTAVIDFFENEMKLQGLKELSYLNGKRYKDLPPLVISALRRSSIPVTMILVESRKSDDSSLLLRHLVFERLNTGGQILNPQEVRNCLYAGHLNDMIVKVARSDEFCDVWGIPRYEVNESDEPSEKLKKSRLFATMQDCAIVLRYFAYADLDKYKAPRKTLDDYMRDNRFMSEDEANKLAEDYLASLNLARQIYKKTLFRMYPHLVSKRSSEGAGALSIPFSDAVLFACKRYIGRSESLIEASSKIIVDTQDLMKSRETYDTLIGSKNTGEEVKARLRMVQDIFGRYI